MRERQLVSGVTEQLLPCPVTACLTVIGGKWKPLLVHLISSGCNRFGAIDRAIPTISKQVLTRQLRELEADGVISRTALTGRTLHVEYSLTARGVSLFPVIHSMRDWGERELAVGPATFANEPM